MSNFEFLGGGGGGWKKNFFGVRTYVKPNLEKNILGGGGGGLFGFIFYSSEGVWKPGPRGGGGVSYIHTHITD